MIGSQKNQEHEIEMLTNGCWVFIQPVVTCFVHILVVGPAASDLAGQEARFQV